MTDTILQGELAIHTSIRTPTGEGYRIVAAGKGLHTRERQAITRCSPSLDSICLPSNHHPDESIGVAYYPLPGTRACVAHSGFAGDEHTGRGARRVYTVNLLFDATRLADCGYNPFRIVRAMIAAGLTEPRLEPPSVLPPIELTVPDDADILTTARVPATLPEALRAIVLEKSLQGRALVVDLEADWTECAEAVLLGIPGPVRVALSFSAGLQFSTARKHTLQFLYDAKGKAKARCATIGAALVTATAPADESVEVSGWTAMASLLWRQGRLADLARRSSQPYDDTSEEARERLAAIFTTLDDIHNVAPIAVARLAEELLNHPATGAEKDVCREFIDQARGSMIERIGALSPQELEILWTQLTTLWRRGHTAASFAQPILDALLRKTMTTRPLHAAQLALQIAGDVPPAADRAPHETLLDAVLTRFAAWATQARDPALVEVPDLVARWRAIRPNSPQLTGVAEHSSAVVEEMGATS